MLLQVLLIPAITLFARVTRASDEAPHQDRPNILWLVSEDNNPYLGCYGDPLAHTPNLDRLASEGIPYTHVHTPAPVCAPTRSSLITGRYAPGIGTQHMRSVIPMPDGLRYYPAFLRDAGYFCTNNDKTDYNAAVLPGTWDENSRTAHWKHRAPGQPFFAVFNYFVTHESSLHKREPLVTDPAAVKVPAYLPDTPETRADIAQYHDRMARLDEQIGKALAELDRAGLADDTIVFYYGDNGGVLPRSKRFLYDNGTHVPLIIRFPKKWSHLAPSAPGTVNDQVVSLVDLPPTLMSLAGIPIPAQFEGRALAGPDRKPGPPYVYAFRDRMDERYDLGRVVIGPRFRYIRNYRPDLPAGQHVDYLWRMASMRKWDELHLAGKLNGVQDAFFQPRQPEELYDVDADPDNIHNLAADPAYADVLVKMRAANRAHLLATRDLGFMPEPMVRRLSRDRSPVWIGHDESLYPLEKLIDMIDRIQLPAHPAGAELVQALNDSSAVVRYWGAVGCLRAETLPPELKARLSDDEASVRIAAADALLHRGDNPDAWHTLDAAIQQGRSHEEQLTALNVISTLPEYPDSLRPALQAFPKPTDAQFTLYVRLVADRLLARKPGSAAE